VAEAEVRVNVGAIEYDNRFVVVSVLAVANAGEDPNLWDLSSVSINATPVTVANVEEHSFPLLHARVWVVKLIGSNLISLGDTVTAVVDLDGGGGSL
jgi:hypothetical protein